MSTTPSRSDRLVAAGHAAAVVLGGGLYAASLPPYGWTLLAWVALIPLLVAVRRYGARSAFFAGLLYGFAYFGGVAPWLVGAVQAYFTTSLLMGLAFFFATGVIYIATYVGLACVGARLLLLDGRWSALVGIPALWVAHELAQTRVLTGLPWGLLSHSQWSVSGLVQIADVTGAFGVTFLIVLVNVAVYLTARDVRALGLTARDVRTLGLAARDGRALGVRRALAPLMVALAVVGAVELYGRARLAQVGTEANAAPSHTIALVQGNAPLVTTWQRAASDRALFLYSDLTQRALAQGPDLVVWPEYALSLYPEGDPRILPQLTGLAAKTGAGIVFGAPRVVGSEGSEHYRNAAYHLAPDGALAAYDKRHLVPFAEYHPLAFGPAVAAAGERSFSAGGPATPFATMSGRLGMLICYEVIYPGLVNDLVRAGAEVLVNVSNDGWLDLAGLGAAEQHLAIAAFRAIETRRYLARAASTGISGFIDPTGRPFALLASATRAITTGVVVPRNDLTLYVRCGDAFACACVAIAVVTVGFALRRKTA